MVYSVVPFIVKDLSTYEEVIKLKEVYPTPRALLCAPALWLPEKKILLSGWHDSRMRYIFEIGRDYDYLLDPEIQEVSKTIQILRETLSAQNKIGMKINIKK